MVGEVAASAKCVISHLWQGFSWGLVALCRNWTALSVFLSCARVPVVLGELPWKRRAETWRMKTMTFPQTAAFLMQWDSRQAQWFDDDDESCTAARWRVGLELAASAGRGACGSLRLPTCKEKEKAFLEPFRNFTAWKGRWFFFKKNIFWRIC